MKPRNRKHLVILGGGSAAFAAAIKANELGVRATIINFGLPIGGTCVNVGCVPSKTLIRAAEAHFRSAHHHFAGIRSESHVTDFKALMDQKRALVAELRQAKYLDVAATLPHLEIINGAGKLVSPRAVRVNSVTVEGTHLLIATGTRPGIPKISGLSQSGYLTNESAFELNALPESLTVIGGRYIALECAQMFARLGARVTILQRSPRILPTEASDVTDALTGYLRSEGINVVTGVEFVSVRKEKDASVVTGIVDGKEEEFRSEKLLVATGRWPNTSKIGLEDVGIKVTEKGVVAVDDHLRTNIETIFGAGDVIGEPEFVYTAAYEGALAAENALSGSVRSRDYTALPWVVFTDPQVAGVGWDEAQAAERGMKVDVSILPLSHVPRCIAARDTRGFIKLIRESESDRIVGARILAPEGSELLMEIALAIKHGLTSAQLREMFHPYLTLSEGVKLAAIAFGKDVETLSCCAT